MNGIRPIILAILFFLSVVPVLAKYDPLTVPNNRFGILIVDPNDLADAAKLVNSAKGDWGYVTLVMQEDDRDAEKWQRIFNEMRAFHLIPIVRLATHIDGDAWVKPYKDSAADWAKFLNSLNWPIENRYVIIYNEPNHANEWGRSLDPENYARTLVSYAKELKKISEDFFILPAGLDVSAASDGRSLDATQYLSRMLKAEPSLFDYLDGWTSHSYPNPAFSGSVFAFGRGTLRSFQWEREYLKQLGVTKKLPIFITETGWVHREGLQANSGLLSSDQVGANLLLAAAQIWTDPDIVAITPFVLNYQGLPFDHFSWKKLGSPEYYPQYGAYQQIGKLSGQPYQREQYTPKHRLVPQSLVAGSTYVLSALLKNEGQGILSEQGGEYSIELVTTPTFLAVREPLPVMEPGQYGTLKLHIETPNVPGEYPYEVVIRHFKRSIVIESGTLALVPPPSIEISAQFGWRADSNTTNATVLVYDHLTLIHKVQGVSITHGMAVVKDLRNVIPGNTYRVVVLVPYYLPRQTISALKPDTTRVRMPRFYPADFNQDGSLTMDDFFAVLKLQPNFTASLFAGN